MLAVLALLVATVVAAAALSRAPAPATPRDPYRWARPAATRLAAAGLWPELAGADLSSLATRADLDRATTILTGLPAASPDPAAPASAWLADRRIVDALGLEPERLGLQALTTDDARPLALPPNFGSEVLVRELGLLRNRSRDELERARAQPVPLATLVVMVDRARALTPEDRTRVALFRSIRLPAMSDARFAVVQAALSQVGQPYVWGGDWPSPRSPWGRQAHGGFDCSGLAWWAYSAGGARPAALGGLGRRTADQMAWQEVAREREAVELAAPGDLVFFGDRGTRSRRGSISHMGIAIGNGWMVQSSGSRAGVSVTFLPEYWPEGQAFGRRVEELGE